MASSYLHFLPPAIFISLPATFIITYFWSVHEDHVYPVLPNISETGAQPPESCLFGMMLNLTAFTMLFSVYVRHKEVVEVLKAKRLFDDVSNAPLFNKVATITGAVACGALNVMANFQEATEIGYVHQLAAVICMYSSTLYLIEQAILSSWLVPEISGMWLVYIRWILGAVATVAVICDTSFTLISYVEYHFDSNDTSAQNIHAPVKHMAHWTPDVPGYTWHCFSSISQWVVVSTLGTYILTFYWDFRKITIFAPELEMRTDPLPEPVKTVNFKAFE
ncbi:Frag1/DRAM/Sfk1 family [Nesidiocoris tenuis]|uniref:Frag1/DRAM/Sfk1 family n=1 Tax=Nesidiocoris tenuis TaxID=355587 RepID=A0ABN7B1Y7_9HEMI|nr:Frag1/DRAM/Sfk1 family [Nesidiocoris tenuis]